MGSALAVPLQNESFSVLRAGACPLQYPGGETQMLTLTCPAPVGRTARSTGLAAALLLCGAGDRPLSPASACHTHQPNAKYCVGRGRPAPSLRCTCCVSQLQRLLLGLLLNSEPHRPLTVLSSSCDIAPGRRQCAALLRVIEIRKSEPDVGAKLNLLLKFKRRDSMYLPPLSQDGSEVVCNVVQFDGICQIRSGDLLLAKRIASLSLVGWHIFSSLSKMVIGRAIGAPVNPLSEIERRLGADDISL